FNAAISNANRNATVVVFDASTIFNDFSAMVDFVSEGGRTVFEFWDLDTLPTVASAFNTSVASDMFVPQPVYDWGGSKLFAGLTNPVNFVESGWGDDGDHLNAIAGGVAVGGYTINASAGQSAIIIGNSGRTILNGFLLDDAQIGSDAVRLAKNEIQYVVGSSEKLSMAPTNTGNFVNGIWTGN